MGEIEDGDDSMEDYEESVRSYVSVYDGEGNYKVDEEGKPLGYHDIYDSDDNTIKSDDSMEENDDDYTYETDFPPGNKNHVDKNKMPFGY